MADTIPSTHLELLTTKPAFANLATLTSSGFPQVTPVWIDFDGTYVIINSAKGRLKDRNMRARKQIGLSISDPANPYRYLGIQGTIVEITEEGGDAHIDRMAKKYMGVDSYPMRQPGEVRVLYKVKPERVHTMG
jgi:PPOX class probable F420-dependent enzyme